MTMLVIQKFLFPPPPSLFLTTMSLISIIYPIFSGFSEVKGKHLNYSKFWNVNIIINDNATGQRKIKLSSKSGMLLWYTPTFLVGMVSFWILPNQSYRSIALQSAITLHFFKRVLEVLFVHKYSGSMVLDSAITVALGYFISIVTMLYAQHFTLEIPEPPINLMYPGIVLFLIGISGNFYHHFLLSKLRGKGEKEYKIPKGGLFGIVICPHYLFEIIGFLGVSFISQTLYAFSFTIGCVFYLLGRSYATKRWYLSKFEHFPKIVKALIPFVF